MMYSPPRWNETSIPMRSYERARGFLRRADAPQLLEALLSGRLHYVQAAEAMQLLNSRWDVQRVELSRLLGMTPQTVLMRLQLMETDAELRALLMESGLPEISAWALLRVPDAPARRRILLRAMREGLTVREVSLLASAAASRGGAVGCSSDAPAPRPAAKPEGRVICLVRDHRPYLNAIRGIVSQMQSAGVGASITETQKNGRVELQVVLPTRLRRRGRYQSM